MTSAPAPVERVIELGTARMGIGSPAQLAMAAELPAAREASRAANGRMVMERLRRAFEKLQTGYLPKSPMGEAIGYALNQWPALERFLKHGEVEVDNKLVENSIWPTAVGKTAWMFFGSEDAGRRNAAVILRSRTAGCTVSSLTPIPKIFSCDGHG